MASSDTGRGPIDIAAVWHAADLADTAAWTIELTDDQRDELARVARAAAVNGRSIATSRSTTRHCRRSVTRSARSCRTHRAEVRLYRTRERQDLHTDLADLIGLLCLHPARSGGASKLASSYAVYNEILRHLRPMWWARHGEESPGDDPAFPMPVLIDVNGRPRVLYIGWYIRDAQRHPRCPRLTGSQLAALDTIETIADDPNFHVQMDFRPGDVQLLNNAKILHSREAYEDHDNLDERRSSPAPLAQRPRLHQRREPAPRRHPNMTR